MKNKDLIEKLQQLPMDLEVCVFDGVKNIEESDEESSVGIYKDFKPYVMMTDEELKDMQAEEGDHVKNWIALEFSRETPDKQSKV